MEIEPCPRRDRCGTRAAHSSTKPVHDSSYREAVAAGDGSFLQREVGNSDRRAAAEVGRPMGDDQGTVQVVHWASEICRSPDHPGRA